MKKYKLIKEYPLSPQLGFIADNVYSYFCEGYPEFWEEIKEKRDWQILEFKKVKGSPFHDIFLITEDEKYRSISGNSTSSWTLEQMLNMGACVRSNHFIINKVKRLSDGEVFCIGDKCQPINYVNPGRIEKFEFVLEDRLRIQGRNEEGKRSWYLSIDTIEKLKTPLFTTLDGKDIYEGDVYYKISSNFNNYYIYKFIASRNSDDYLQENKGYLTFSSKETVQKYIEQNKPQFSLKQVINILKGFDKEVNEFEYQDGEMQYSEYIEKYKNGE